MNELRKQTLRHTPDLITRDEVLQLVQAKPDVWRYVRGACKVTGLLGLYFILWGVLAFLTDSITPTFITLLVACWTAPNVLRKL